MEKKRRSKLGFLEEATFGYTSVVLYLITVLLVIVEIVRRYVFNAVFYWSIDIVIYFFLLSAYLYFGLTAKEDIHLKVSFLPDRLRPPWKDIFSIVALVVSVVYCILFIAGTVMAGRQAMKMGLQTENVVLPIAPLYFLLGLGFLHLLTRYVIQIFNVINALKKRTRGDAS